MRSLLCVKTNPYSWQLADLLQDGSGWTPLMIAVSLKDGEDLVDLFLQKGADVNATSKWPYLYLLPVPLFTSLDFTGQVIVLFTSGFPH
jgi:hypothetical protein